MTSNFPETNPFRTNDVKSSDVDMRPSTPSSRSSASEHPQSIGLEASSSRLYHIYHSAIRYDYRVMDAHKNQLYFVYNSHLTPKKADITFHAGEDNKAPVAGVCKFIKFTRQFKVGLGDPDRAGDMVWEDLQGQNFTKSKYRWPMSVPSPNGGLERRWFLWTRTHSQVVEGELSSLFSFRNFKLVDELTGQIVAIFTSNTFKSIRKNGKLQVVGEYGPDFDLMVLITILAIYEKTRRRRAAKGGGGGGGGGDGG